MTERPVALLDANVLYSAIVRDLYIRFARAGLITVRWSDAIHREWRSHLARNRPDLDPRRIERTRELMDASVPDARVTGFEWRMHKVEMPDPDDRHVLAAAAAGGATVIITFDLAHFPPYVLHPYGIAVAHPDAFATELIEREPAAAFDVVSTQRAALVNPPLTWDDLFRRFESAGLPLTAARLRELLAAG